MANAFDLETFTDSDFLVQFTCAEDDCGDERTDLTPYTITSHIKSSATDEEPTAEFTVVKDNATRGLFSLGLEADEIPSVGIYVYDVRFEHTDGAVLPRFVRGTFTVSEAVTKEEIIVP